MGGSGGSQASLLLLALTSRVPGPLAGSARLSLQLTAPWLLPMQSKRKQALQAAVFLNLLCAASSNSLSKGIRIVALHKGRLSNFLVTLPSFTSVSLRPSLSAGWPNPVLGLTALALSHPAPAHSPRSTDNAHSLCCPSDAGRVSGPHHPALIHKGDPLPSPSALFKLSPSPEGKTRL